MGIYRFVESVRRETKRWGRLLVMGKWLHIVTVVGLGTVGTACTSVPEVESRLQTLQLHSNMYVVQAGDTLETIAFRYQLTPADIAAMNPGAEVNLRPGMRINVRPGTTLSAAARAGGRFNRNTEVVAINRNQNRNVTLHPTSQNGQVQLEPVANSGGVVPIEQVKVFPAASWDNDNQVAKVDGNYPREEIIPDTMEFTAVATDSELLKSAENIAVSGTWQWPTAGQVAREFQPNEVGGQGVDITGVPGQDIRAAMDGTVIYSGRDLSAGGGSLVIVRHANNLMTTYSHADNLFVAEDDVVRSGDPIASLGWNERRESVLRFEVRRDGNPMNPLEFLPKR